MIKRVLLIAALLVLVLGIPSVIRSGYVLDVLAYGLALAMYAVAVSIVFGQMGYVTFGHAAFLGLGAYTAAILTQDHGWNYWAAVTFAIVPGVVLGLGFGFLAGRLSGAYFAIATLVIAGLFEFAASNLVGLTNGPMGKMVMVQSPGLAKLLQWSDAQAYLGVLIAYLGVVLIFVWCLLHSPIGRQWNAVRENISLAESLGIPTLRVRVAALAVSGAIAALAGGLLVPKVIVVAPNLFNIKNSAIGVLAAIFGGKATLAGPVIGGALFAILPEAFRSLGSFNFAIFALILLVTVIVFPGGLMSLWDLLPKRTMVAHNVQDIRTAASHPLVRTTNFPKEKPVIAVKGVGKIFGGLAAVKDVDLEVHGAEILGIIGPNGAGKTTLFTMLSGFQTPTHGHIEVFGRSIAGLSPYQISDIGLVRTFQQAAQFSSLSIRSNMLIATCRNKPTSIVATAFRTSSFKTAERERMQIALACLREVGLENRLDENAASLPYGEQKLLGVAMALATGPSIMLLDEPAAGLNMVEANKLREVLVRLRQKGLTIVIVDHNLTMLMSFVDRIVVLHHGVKIADGKPEEVALQPDVVEAYLGVQQPDAVAEVA